MKKQGKIIAGLLIFTLVLTLLPTSVLAEKKVPKKTKITKIELKANKVSLRWKKIKKCRGYKVYRKINNGRRVCIKTIKRKNRIRYTDTIPTLISGTVKYQVAAYRKIKVNKKRKLYKSFSKARKVIIEATGEPLDLTTTEITEDIYNKYSKLTVDELSMDEVRSLVLYKLNDIRSKEHVQHTELENDVPYDDVLPQLNKLEMDDALNKCAVAEIEQLNKGIKNPGRIGELYDEIKTDTERTRLTSVGTVLSIENKSNIKSIINKWIDELNIYNNSYWLDAEYIGVGFKDNRIMLEFGCNMWHIGKINR